MHPRARAASQRLTCAAVRAMEAGRFTSEHRRRLNRVLKALKRSAGYSCGLRQAVEALGREFQRLPGSEVECPGGELRDRF